MTQQHLTTLIHQARAFLDAHEPADATRLLEQARMLARDDIGALAEVYALQAKAAVMMNRGADVVSYARQAIQLDRNANIDVGWLAEECEVRGLEAAANSLRELGHLKARPQAASRRRLAAISLASAAAVAAVLCALYYLRLPPFLDADSRRQATARLDIERVRDNVGLVIVSAKYTCIDGRSVTHAIGMGSCFAVSADGYLLTNKHVTSVRGEKPDEILRDGVLYATRDWWKIKVCFGPEETEHFEARLVYESPYRDIAVLKVDRRFPEFLRREKEWAPGDDVYAAGYPGAVSDAIASKNLSDILRNAASESEKSDADFSNLIITEAAYDVTITRGVISAVRRIEGQAHVQTDTVITPGNSGGPLMTRDCKVVGINTWTTTQSEAYNFALSLEEMIGELRPFVNIE